MMLKAIIRAADSVLERRSTLRNPADWLVDAWVGPKTVSGERITPASALTLPAYFAAIRNISEDLGKLPLKLYRRNSQGKSEAYAEPLYRTLHDAPNDEMTAITFRSVLQQHAMGWGNGYAEIVRVSGGVSLWPLDPRRVVIDRVNNSLVYILRQNGEERERVLDGKDVFHIPGFGFDGLSGYSLATVARESFGLAMAEMKSGAALFGNSSRPGGVLQTPEALDEDARKNLRSSWERMHGGGENSYRTAILEEGVTFSPIAMASKDAQWIESRRFSVLDVCRILRIQPVKIAELTDANYSNWVEANLDYVTDTLMPWAVRWEQEIMRKLIVPMVSGPGRPSMFAEHVFAGLLRGDIESRYRAHSIARQWGWESANDVREIENMNSIGPQGDIYMIPQNMGDAKALLEPPEPKQPKQPNGPDGQDEPADAAGVDANLRLIARQEAVKVAREHENDVDRIVAIAKAHTPMLAEAYRAVLKVESDKVRRAASKPGFFEWVDGYYIKVACDVRKRLESPVDTFVSSVFAALERGAVSELVRRQVSAELDAMTTRHVEMSKSGLRRRSDSVVKATLDDWANGRAERAASVDMTKLAGVLGTRT